MKELRKRIDDLKSELGEKEDQTRDLEVKLFEASFTSADPDLSATASPPSSSSRLPSQPPVQEESIEFGLQIRTPASRQRSSIALHHSQQTPSVSRRNTLSALHSSGLPKPGTSRIPFRPSALPTPSTGKTRPDQRISSIASVLGNAGGPAGHPKFGFGVGRQSLGVGIGGKLSKVSPPGCGDKPGDGKAGDGNGKIAKLESEVREKTSEIVGLKAKLAAAKQRCVEMDKMKVDLEREKEKVSLNIFKGMQDSCVSIFINYE